MASLRLDYPRGNESILLVEPDPETRVLAMFMLGRLGYRAVEARTGAEAIRLSDQAGGFDLVVVESAMPKMNGYDVAERLKERYSRMRFLFLSARPITQKGLRFLCRPFTMGSLATGVRAALDEGGGKMMTAGG